MTYSKYYVDKSRLPDYTLYPMRADGFHTEIGYKLFIADTLAKLEEISVIAKQKTENTGYRGRLHELINGKKNSYE